MADLTLSNGSSGIIKLGIDNENASELDIDIDRTALQESLIKSSQAGDELVLISYGSDIPDSSTPGKIYIQI